ncbi:hypothetical protein PVK06_003955 [Gossypium arboreum]|uniref:Uncharacterized protein n=1 Tax=Gossypium arboreum TaxID=29729 RepID=A0ABR0QR14_GOSAR|nr:hypothetical protein PVK06_003955 [Gossypium arboreum]
MEDVHMSNLDMNDYLCFASIMVGLVIMIHLDMLIGVKVAKLGWDLSLRAQSRKALSMNSIWLREDDDGKSEGEKRYIRCSTNRIWGADNTVRGGKVIDPILGFNLEGGSSNLDLQKENKTSDWMNTVMEHDLEGVIIGEERKKSARGTLEDVAGGEETDNLLVRNRILVEINHSISAASKRQADRSQ